MSVPDVVLLSIRAAGVDRTAQPITWDICKHDDGSVSSYMRWIPSAVKNGEGSLPCSAGKCQLSNPAAGPQSPDISTHPSAAGKPQLASFIRDSAGSSQPSSKSPSLLRLTHHATISQTPAHRSKHRCPSQRRRSARRRAAWRQTLQADSASVVLQKLPSDSSDVP